MSKSRFFPPLLPDPPPPLFFPFPLLVCLRSFFVFFSGCSDGWGETERSSFNVWAAVSPSLVGFPIYPGFFPPAVFPMDRYEL